MIVNDLKLLDQLYLENDELTEFDELDLSNQRVQEMLSKIQKISINFSPRDSLESIENTIKQLIIILDKCPNINFFRIFSSNTESKQLNIDNLIDILVNHNVNRVVLSGFNYDYPGIYSKIVSSDKNTVLNLDKVNDPVSAFTYIFGSKKLRSKLHFDSFNSEELKALYVELHNGFISLDNYKKYKDYLTNYNDLYISIGNVSNLDLEYLETIKKNSHIKGIFIKCGYTRDDKAQYYSLDEYESIRNTINDIVKMVKLPSHDDPNREKIIFAQIYKILGKNIRYDRFAVTDSGREDYTLSLNCRNLKNGLLGVERDGKKILTSVCAGYATILQNVCACFDIKCDYISSFSKEVTKPGVFVIRGPRQYENGTTDPMGHAYNAVYLDGKAYLCDLTWDANLMKLDNLGPNFLKSYEEFCKSHKDEGFSAENVNVVNQNGDSQHSLKYELFTNSCSFEEQIQLFGVAAKGNIDDMISEGYLADFAMKNIEFIKQVKGEVAMLEFIKLIQLIHKLEEYIKSSEFKERAGWAAQGVDTQVTDENGNVLETKNIIFYPGSAELSPSAAADLVTGMEERQWKVK